MCWYFSPILLPLILCYLGQIAAVSVNRTIDDTVGDSVTGARPVFLPQTAGVWEDVTCVDCAIQPDRNLAFKGTWTAATFKPRLGSISVHLSFTGTAIYVFLILANNVADGVATETACNFTLDGSSAGSFSHIPSTSTLLEYNSLVFSRANLANTAHSLVLTTSVADREIFVNFDYALYTFDDTSTASPSALPSPTTTPTASPSALPSLTTTTTASPSALPSPTTHSTTGSATSTSSTKQSQSSPDSTNAAEPKSKVNVGVIAGGAVGGVAVICILILLLFLLCRRRRDRLRYQPSKFSIDGDGGTSTSRSAAITPYPIDVAPTTARFQTRPDTQSDFLQSGTIFSPYSANQEAPQSFYDMPNRFVSGPAPNNKNGDINHSVSDTSMFASAYGGIASDTSSSRGLATVAEGSGPLSLNSSSASSADKNREELRRARQSAIDRQVQAVTREIADLKTDIQAGVSQRPSVRSQPAGSASTEMDEMREQMQEMRQQLEYLKEQRHSEWAQGLSGEAPPGYSRS
ncbi:hypothetical protein DXG01_001955 [Tephrocybe rancida]|nr:hypothetical protein DXG01_001955 [Tephrocybe rancida]